MKAAVVILLCAFCSIECRKIVQVSKHANVDFINMEAGGQGYPRPAPAQIPLQPPSQPSNPPKSPTQPEAPKTPIAAPSKPVVTPKPAAVVPVTTAPAKPVQPQQPRPNQGISTQMDLKPVQSGKPIGAGGSVTTPGPGSVKQLITYYDSQGKASNIRPYSYSDAVKKGH